MSKLMDWLRGGKKAHPAPPPPPPPVIEEPPVIVDPPAPVLEPAPTPVPVLLRTVSLKLKPQAGLGQATTWEITGPADLIDALTADLAVAGWTIGDAP